MFVLMRFSKNVIYLLMLIALGLQTFCLKLANLSANMTVDKVSPLLKSCYLAQKMNCTNERPLIASFMTRVIKHCFQGMCLGTSFPSVTGFLSSSIAFMICDMRVRLKLIMRDYM